MSCHKRRGSDYRAPGNISAPQGQETAGTSRTDFDVASSWRVAARHNAAGLSRALPRNVDRACHAASRRATCREMTRERRSPTGRHAAAEIQELAVAAVEAGRTRHRRPRDRRGCGRLCCRRQRESVHRDATSCRGSRARSEPRWCSARSHQRTHPQRSRTSWRPLGASDTDHGGRRHRVLVADLGHQHRRIAPRNVVLVTRSPTTFVVKPILSPAACAASPRRRLRPAPTRRACRRRSACGS